MDPKYITQTIQPLRDQLLRHTLYDKIRTIDDLCLFQEIHVYAVWDFMSLLKALQAKLTCVTTPWFATENAETRYLINEIVLAEETDVALNGTRQSHFEMYISAMKSCGATTFSIEHFLRDVATTHNIFVSIQKSGLDQGVKDFLDFTFRIIDNGKPHEIAAAFTFGREDLIPGMFTELLKNFQKNFPDTDLRELIYYFERHIELDADDHGPKALQMVSELCGSDPVKWKEAERAAVASLQKRIGLWDTIEKQIDRHAQLV